MGLSARYNIVPDSDRINLGNRKISVVVKVGDGGKIWRLNWSCWYWCVLFVIGSWLLVFAASPWPICWATQLIIASLSTPYVRLIATLVIVKVWGVRFVVVLGGSKKKKERRFWHVSRLGGHGENRKCCRSLRLRLRPIGQGMLHVVACCVTENNRIIKRMCAYCLHVAAQLAK